MCGVVQTKLSKSNWIVFYDLNVSPIVFNTSDNDPPILLHRLYNCHLLDCYAACYIALLLKRYWIDLQVINISNNLFYDYYESKSSYWYQVITHSLIIRKWSTIYLIKYLHFFDWYLLVWRSSNVGIITMMNKVLGICCCLMVVIVPNLVTFNLLSISSLFLLEYFWCD